MGAGEEEVDAGDSSGKVTAPGPTSPVDVALAAVAAARILRNGLAGTPSPPVACPPPPGTTSSVASSTICASCLATTRKSGSEPHRAIRRERDSRNTGDSRLGTAASLRFRRDECRKEQFQRHHDVPGTRTDPSRSRVRCLEMLEQIDRRETDNHREMASNTGAASTDDDSFVWKPFIVFSHLPD